MRAWGRLLLALLLRLLLLVESAAGLVLPMSLMSSSN